jgi:hypothetical protein
MGLLVAGWGERLPTYRTQRASEISPRLKKLLVRTVLSGWIDHLAITDDARSELVCVERQRRTGSAMSGGAAVWRDMDPAKVDLARGTVAEWLVGVADIATAEHGVAEGSPGFLPGTGGRALVWRMGVNPAGERQVEKPCREGQRHIHSCFKHLAQLQGSPWRGQG